MAISDMVRKNKIVFGEDHQDPSYGEPSLTVYVNNAYTINGSMTKNEAMKLLDHLKRIIKEIELGRPPFDFIR